MKKSRLFIALLVMLVAASGFAQDSYREALKDYFALNGGTEYFDQVAPVLKQSSMFLFKSGGLDLGQLTDRYVKEGLTEYMVNSMLPKIKELGVSEEEIRATSSLLSTPEGKTYIEHSGQLTEALKSEFTAILSEKISKIENGEFPDLIQPKAGIDAEYIEKFKNVFESKSNYTKLMQQTYDSYINYYMGFTEKLGMKMSADLTKKMENFYAWMIANLPTMAMNEAYGIITLDDIDFAAKLCSGSTFDKLQSLVSTVNIESFGANMVANYVEWMQEHGAVLQDAAIEVINMMKEMHDN